MKLNKVFIQYKGLRKEMYVLFFGRIMTNLGAMIWPMFTIILSTKLGMEDGPIGVFMMIYSLVMMPLGLVGGKLADKFNKKYIIVICDGVSVLSYIYCALVPISYTSIIIFAVASLFQNIEWPSYDALVADFTKTEDRERAYSLMYLGTNLGMVIGPILGGFLVANYLNLAFAINGISIAASTLFILIAIKDVSKEISTTPAGEYEKDIDEKTPALSWVIKNRVIMLFVIASSIGWAIYGMYSYMMPLDLSYIYGDSIGPKIYGTMSSINCVIVIAFTAVVTVLLSAKSDIFKQWSGECLILFGYFLFMLFADVPAVCFISIAVFTFGEIMMTVSSSPFMTNRIPASHRGRILSIISVIQSFATSISTAVIGYVHGWFGMTVSWIIVLVFGALTVALFIITGRLDKKDYKNLYQ